jgi:hypothetical protein
MEELKKDNKNDFDHAFAPVIFEIVKAIKSSEENSKTRKELKATLKVALQKYTNFETQMVSEKAYEYIVGLNNENHTYHNPFNLNFDQHRKKFGETIDKKNKIMWEHVIPISHTIEYLEKEDRYHLLEEILKYLKEYPGTCLITREEDDKLNEKHKTNRTDKTWKSIYKDLEIIVKNRSEFSNL